MRHHNTKRKFGRVKNQRDTLLKSLALNLIVRGKIKTTLPKAKELRPFIEKIVTGAKKGDLASQKRITAKLTNRVPEVRKLFKVIAPKYADRKGGYTRIIKLGVRKSDGAEMAQIGFIE
jgi:large subunit ribosomal protein L17